MMNIYMVRASTISFCFVQKIDKIRGRFTGQNVVRAHSLA